MSHFEELLYDENKQNYSNNKTLSLRFQEIVNFLKNELKVLEMSEHFKI